MPPRPFHHIRAIVVASLVATALLLATATSALATFPGKSPRTP